MRSWRQGGLGRYLCWDRSQAGVCRCSLQPHPPTLQGCPPAACVLRRLPGRALGPEAWQAGAATAAAAAGAPGTATPAAAAASQLLPGLTLRGPGLSTSTPYSSMAASALPIAPQPNGGLVAALGAPAMPASQAGLPRVSPATAQRRHASHAASANHDRSPASDEAAAKGGEAGAEGSGADGHPAGGRETDAVQKVKRWLKELEGEGYTISKFEMETEIGRLKLSQDGNQVSISITRPPYCPFLRLAYCAIGCALTYMAVDSSFAIMYFLVHPWINQLFVPDVHSARPRLRDLPSRRTSPHKLM